MSQHVSPEFRPNKAHDAVKRIQLAKEEATRNDELMSELSQRATSIVKNGNWQERGEVYTFEKGIIGSRRRWLETFNGTEFIRLNGSECSVALREVSAEDGTHNVKINLLAKESDAVDQEAEVLAVFACGQVYTPDIDTVTADVLSDLQDVLTEVELQLQQSNGS